MTDDRAVDDDGYCELHSFKKIGDVSSDVGTIAIIDIGSGRSVTEWFTHLTGNDDAAHNAIREFTMVQSHELSLDGWKGLTELGIVINTAQDFFPVYARYCDHYGDGRMSICELRIDLHGHDGDDDRDGDASPSLHTPTGKDHT